MDKNNVYSKHLHTPMILYILHILLFKVLKITNKIRITDSYNETCTVKGRSHDRVQSSL